MSVIDRAFGQDEGLRSRITRAITSTPQLGPLFEEIAVYHISHSTTSSTNGNEADTEEPASKRRKLVNGSLPIGTPQTGPRQVIFEARDISFSIPQRKKLHLEIVQCGQDSSIESTTFAICTRNTATKEIELEVPLSSYAYCFRLPVPEKAQKQYNFCLIPKPGFDKSAEPIIWTVNHGPLKSFQISDSNLQHQVSNSEEVLERVLEFTLRRSGSHLTLPTEAEFASATPESHRKGDKAYHVKAFRGSKDGFLFFLENGIFFGFKKPLAFFAFNDIDSISYTSVLQRTFNMNIAYKDAPDAETQEIEFAMLDPADFPGIDAYIKKHQLQDASMAEARRAKTIKSATKQASTANADDTDDATELQKAQEELEDEEDELEEDYDPGDEGDSDGSGSDSGEDEEAYADDEDQNLVDEELGSEVEDDGPDPDDEDQL